MCWKVWEMVMGGEKQEERRPDARDEGNTLHLMGMRDVCELYGAVWLWMEVQRLQNYRKHLYFSKGGSKVEGPAVTVTTHPGIEINLLSKPVSYVIKVHVEFIKRQLWVVCVKTMSHFWWHVPFDAFLFWRRNVPNTVPITAFLSSKNVSDVIRFMPIISILTSELEKLRYRWSNLDSCIEFIQSIVYANLNWIDLI